MGSGKIRQRFPVWLPVSVPLLLLAVGCHRDDVKVYRVARDQDQPQQQTAPAMPTDSPNPGLPPGHPDISSTPNSSFPAPAGLPQVTWKTPDGWMELPAGQMRVGSFKVNGAGGKSADVSIIPLPGMAVGDDANVNRWRGQVGLAPLGADEITKSAEAVEAGGQPAQLYDIPGNTERILGAIQRRDDVEWFYKMTGDPELVEQQKPVFVAFLKSLAFGPAAAPAEVPPGHPATGDQGMGMAPAMSGATSGADKPNWQVPAGWQEVPGGQFLAAKFNLTGDNGAVAAVNVSRSAGGLLSNINRWRGQLGLPPLADADVDKSVTPLDVAGGKAALVDFSGTDVRTGKPTRLVGVIVPLSGQTWFYKLMGDTQVVESQKTAFLQFVQGAKY